MNRSIRRFGAGLSGLALVVGLAAAAPARAETAAAHPSAELAPRPVAAAKPKASLGDDRLALAFRVLPGKWDPARRSDFAFVPEPSPDAVAVLAALRVIAVEAEAVGDRRTAISATMLVGHVLRIHEAPGARDLLEVVIAEATKAGWRDGEMRTALHDLAVILTASGDARAAGLEKRAGACPRPCASDRPTQLYARGRKAEAAASSEAEVPIGERLAALKIARPWLRDTLGASSPWYRMYLAAHETEFEDERPFTALDLAREQLVHLVEPEARAAHLVSLSLSLRRAGDYREAAERAAEAATLWAQLGKADEARVAGWEETMARLRLGDTAARARLQAQAPGLSEMLIRQNDISNLRALAYDLIGSHLTAEADPVLEAIVARSDGLWGSGQYLRGAALAGRARIAMRAGRFDAAEALLDQAEAAAPKIDTPDHGVLRIGLLAERAALRAAQGRTDEAATLRAAAEAATKTPVETEPASFVIGAMTELRDLGGIDGGGVIAEIATGMLDEDRSERPSYETAQTQWQIAYSLALAGKAEPAFAQMKSAAAIAVRHSFESVDDTDGGSLQLMRRDRWRYLLFVDIAWSAAKKRPPEEMTVPARY